MGPVFRLEELEQAWLRVEDNEGCAGADGVTVERFAARLSRALAGLLDELHQGLYRPLPLLKILVEKAPGSRKTRRLLVPAVRDRVLQTAAARRLSRSFEEEFLDSSYAYRPGSSVDRAVARVVQLRDRGFLYIVDGDIQTFFDSVSHSRLLELLAAQQPGPGLMALLRDWVRAEVWDGSRVRTLARGIPQGSPLSPLLANFFLGDFDVELQKSEHHLVRYADDFLILCRTEEAARQALALTSAWMKANGLRLNHEKTRITSFAAGFQFLGVFFLGEHVYIPWKGERPKGRLLFAAPPMPARLLANCRRPKARGAMELALRNAGPLAAPAPKPTKGGRNVAHLYITEQGAILRKSGERFLVEKEDRIVLDLPYHKLENVLLFGHVQVTTQAIGELLEKGIPLSFFSAQGRYRGSLAAPHGKDVFLRIAQYRLYENAPAALALARVALEAKLDNALAVLRAYAARAGMIEALQTELAAIERARRDLAAAPDLESIVGLEGAAARLYFPALMRFNRSGFAWPGRVNYPATDPVNALLSLTYMLLLHELSGLLEGLGLDPYLGFLHQPDYGRPSLALDLLEPFRHPVADRLVMTLLNRRTLAGADFETRDGQEGVFLKPESLKEYLGYYERWMRARPSGSGESFRAGLKREAESLVRYLRGKDAAWEPFRWKGSAESGEEACNTSSVTI